MTRRRRTTSRRKGTRRSTRRGTRRTHGSFIEKIKNNKIGIRPMVVRPADRVSHVITAIKPATLNLPAVIPKTNGFRAPPPNIENWGHLRKEWFR